MRNFCAFLLLALLSPSAHAYVDEVRASSVWFTSYKPIYFLAGQPYTKIQVSFKGQLVETWPIYFGYTQLMMWKLFIKNPAFKDLNYNPELFYRFQLGGGESNWLDVSPYEHESNGRGTDLERSWNRAYVRYQWGNLSESSRLLWSVKAWVPYLLSRNSDLAQYRGLGELVVTYANFLGSFSEKDDLTLRLYLGGASYIDPTHGGQELTLRVKLATKKLLPPLVLQIFHGYGENLVDYRERRLAVRLGFGF